MNHKDMIAEGNRLGAILDIQTSIVQDKQALPEQVRVVMATGQKHKDRMNLLAEAIHKDCKCGHPKQGHQGGGRGGCLLKTDVGVMCACQEWAVEL